MDNYAPTQPQRSQAMSITIQERQAMTTLTHHLSIDPNLLNRPEAQAARQRGLLRAKAEALRSAEHLVGWARPLLVGVLIVSFLHLWHQIARIAPTEVPPLSLPAWTHWLSAALLTISVDATALYLMATRSTAQYARMGGQGSLAVWFFYILTAALNSLFVLSYTPNLPQEVQLLTPALALLGAILLGLLVPISIAALERARQVTDIARLALLVEVETLRGLTTSNPESSEGESDEEEQTNAEGRAETIIQLFAHRKVWRLQEMLENVTIPRSTLQRDLAALVAQGRIVAQGATKNRIYLLASETEEG